MNGRDELIGKVLTKIEVKDNETTLLLHTNDGVYKYDADGDCCSSSWIEHFNSPSESCTITDMKEIEVPPSYEGKPTVHDHYEEEIKYYFYEIITDKGSYQIEMRNSSNGYYGGSLDFYGLVQLLSTEDKQ